MKPPLAFLLLGLLTLAACTPAEPTLPPGAVLFPTVTPGYVIVGALATPLANPDAQNPATAVAQAARPTATPNRGICPVQTDGITLATRTETGSATQHITRFLTLGGAPAALAAALDEEWGAIGETGYLREGIDITGEGTPDLVLGFTDPEGAGTLLILGCVNGQYTTWGEVTAEGPTPPQILWLGDLNRDQRADVVYTTEICEAEDSCELLTQILSWNPVSNSLRNLIDAEVRSSGAPTIGDIDNDDVAEVIVTLENNGTSTTGPLRTGTHVYDWNGSVYTLSIVQLNPPRYAIQVLHEADRRFNQLRMADAESLYRLVLENDDTYGYWFSDGRRTLLGYVLYRLIVANLYLRDNDELPALYGRLAEAFPILPDTQPDTLPVYTEMAYTFWTTYDTSRDLHLACEEVRRTIERRPEALDLLNRYGSRSPTYTALDLCPF
jgi:hypothetical protein